MTTRGAGIEARFRGGVGGGFRLDAAFDAPATGVTAIFGPSGGGKTTLLRCIAGLTRMPGRFALAGEVWQDEDRFLPVHRRPIGYVFQEPSLFAHLSVAGNLAYARNRAGRLGLQGSGLGGVSGDVSGGVAFDEAVDLLGIAPLLGRAPGHLSGGERQRVAIGRALLSRPRLILMDEPLAALDRPSRLAILPYLERVRDALGIPILYVSHDLAEVERLAGHVVVLRDGAVAAAGALERLQGDPDLPLAATAQAGVTLTARIVRHIADWSLTELRLAGAALWVPGRLGEPGAARRVKIAANDVSLTLSPARDSTVLNVLPARILASTDQGEGQVMVALALGPEADGARILARISRRSWQFLNLGPGRQVHAQIKGVSLVAPRD